MSKQKVGPFSAVSVEGPVFLCPGRIFCIENMALLFTGPCTTLHGIRVDKAAISGIQPLAEGDFSMGWMRYSSRPTAVNCNNKAEKASFSLAVIYNLW